MSILPAAIWDQIDRISRIQCCVAVNSEKCKGYPHQGTRSIYSYEILSRSVEGALQAARNTALDDAVAEISRLATMDGRIQKSEALELIVNLKWPPK